MVYSVCDSLTLVLRRRSHITHNGCYTVDHEVQVKTTRAYLQELERHIMENASCIAPYLPHINAHLHNAVLASRAAQSSIQPSSFTNKQHIPSGQKPVHQWRFKKQAKHQVEKERETHYSKSSKNTFDKNHVTTFPVFNSLASPQKRKKLIQTFHPVSYTHLTLPTKRIV